MGDKTVVAADGTNLAHRAFYALGGAASLDGVHRRVVAYLVAAASAAHTERVLVAFDAPDALERRRELFVGYKSARSAKPDGLVEVLGGLPSRLQNDGVPTVTVAGCEADDVLAAAAEQFEQTACFTSDKDAFALVRDPHVAVVRPSSPLEWVTDAKLQERFGVSGSQYALFAAFRGDSSDGLEGLEGVGPVLASKLVAQVGSFDGFVAAVVSRDEAVVSALGPSRAARLFDDPQAAVERVRRNLVLSAPFPVPLLGRVPRWARLEPPPPF